MKLWKISQTINRDYDTYDSAIVAASTRDEARLIHPEGDGQITQEAQKSYDTWAGLSSIEVEELGLAKDGIKAGIILASFNAG